MPSKVSLLAVGGVGVRQVKSVTAAQPKKVHGTFSEGFS